MNANEKEKEMGEQKGQSGVFKESKEAACVKSLDNVNFKQAQANDPGIKFFGDPDVWKLLCKVSSEKQGWMKSTKVLETWNGFLVQVSTQQRNPDGSYALAEALAYVPSNSENLVKERRR